MPAVYGPCKTTLVGEAQQGGDFLERKVGIQQIAIQQALPDFIDQLMECQLLVLETALQCARAHVHEFSDFRQRRLADAYLLLDDTPDMRDQIRTVMMAQFTGGVLVVKSGHCGIGEDNLAVQLFTAELEPATG